MAIHEFQKMLHTFKGDFNSMHVAIITALLSILFKSMIPESVSVKVGAEAVDNILNILASSMLAVTTFSLSIMVTACTPQGVSS